MSEHPEHCMCHLCLPGSTLAAVVSNTPICQSCGVAFEYHDGVSVLCSNLTAARAEVEAADKRNRADEELLIRIARERDVLKAEVERLKDELRDIRDTHKTVMLEPCGTEKHCTCVPFLRQEIRELKESRYSVEELQAYARFLADVDAETGFVMDLEDCMTNEKYGIAAFIERTRKEEGT